MKIRERYLTSLRDRPLLERLWLDLQPAPGRLNRSLRIMLASIIVVIVMLVLQMPFIAYGLYAVFLVGVESPSASFKAGTGIIIICAMAIGTELCIVILTDNDPMARLVSVSIVTFLGGMIVAATTKSSLGSSWGILFCILIATWDRSAPENVLVKSSLWLLAAFSLATACTVAVELVFGTSEPEEQLRAQFCKRYEALITMYAACSQGATMARRHELASQVFRLAAAGVPEMFALYHSSVDRAVGLRRLHAGTELRIILLTRLMDESASYGFEDRIESDFEERRRCARLAERCAELADGSHATRGKELLRSKAVGTDLLSKIEELVDVLWTGRKPGDIENESSLANIPIETIPLVIPGAIRNLESVAFALKISLCATVCFIIYHAIAWPGISTCVTTVMVAGLSTSSAMKEKLGFRLAGVILGGLVLGLGTTVFLYPRMDSVTSFVVLVSLVSFGIAWISGGARFSALSTNIAFSFYVVAIAGSRAQRELSPARDRLVGILLGLCVLWIVFDWLWPAPPVTRMLKILASVIRKAATTVSLGTHEKASETIHQEVGLRRQIGSDLAALRALDESIEYDLGADRKGEIEVSDLIVQTSLSVAALAWSQERYLRGAALNLGAQVQVRPDLKQTVSKNLLIFAGAVEAGTRMVGTWPDTEVAELPFSGEQLNEYEQMLVDRYDTLETLLSTLARKRATL